MSETYTVRYSQSDGMSKVLSMLSKTEMQNK